MLELSKQLADIVKPMVHNKIQVAQQQAHVKENFIMLAPWENPELISGLASQPRG